MAVTLERLGGEGVAGDGADALVDRDVGAWVGGYLELSVKDLQDVVVEVEKVGRSG